MQASNKDRKCVDVKVQAQIPLKKQVFTGIIDLILNKLNIKTRSIIVDEETDFKVVKMITLSR